MKLYLLSRTSEVVISLVILYILLTIEGPVGYYLVMLILTCTKKISYFYDILRILFSLRIKPIFVTFTER